MLLPSHPFIGASALDTTLVWLAALAFLAGGIANAVGPSPIRATYVRLGFPVWWRWITATLEVMAAVLIAGDGTTGPGVGLGAVIMLVAIAAILRVRYFRELPPPIAFLVLLILAGVSAG